VWSQTEYPGPGSAATGVFASYRLPGGDFPATPQTVISGLTNSHRAQIAVAPDGSVTLVAQINDGSGSRIAAFTHANPAAPKNTEPPQTSAPNGTNAGATITCSTGTWTASPTSYLFEWLVDGKSLGPGAASSSHVITAAELGHQLSCRVTASNAAGSGQATSEAIVPGNGSGGGPGPGGPGSPSASKIKAHGDSASADVSCPSGGGSCPVTLQLTAASGHKARDSKVTVVGSTSAVVRPGQHRTVKVGLNHMGTKLLRAHGKLRVKLVVRSGKQLVATKSLVLRRPAKKHRG
jgi:hypothetical protein